MRVLTVRDPWAWAIIRGGKAVENRTRNIAGDYRGPVAIHVSKSPACRIGESVTGADVTFTRDISGYLARSDRFAWPYRLPWWDGHVIGVVDLWAVHRDTGGGCCTRDGAPWGERDVWHLCLTDPRPLTEPIPATGRLGLWRPDADLLARIEAAPPLTPVR